ncbi:MAG: hypothetical protein P8X94_02595 [Woeseiaceae bacterium]
MSFRKSFRVPGACALALLIAACAKEPPPDVSVQPLDQAEVRPEIYAEFRLTADLDHLSDEQQQMIGLLIEAADIMDDLFWRQSFGDGYEEWLASITDSRTRRFAEINYGPWDALDDDKPFMDGFGPKPPGAQFYPDDMSKDEFENAFLPGKAGLYSFIRRNAEGKLTLVPYHVEYADELAAAARLLREAAALAESPDFATYLKLRAAALISDEFQLSDSYWMDVKDNEIDVVIGPIETYMDRLFGYRTAYEAYVLVKDLAWSERLDCRKGCPFPVPTNRSRPGLTPISMHTMLFTMRVTAMPARRRSRSICRTTSRSSSRKDRAACNSRTRCRPSTKKYSSRLPMS